MLDDFREQASESLFLEEETPEIRPRPSRSSRKFLGMSPAQRFLISLMLLFVACILSTLFLLVTEKMVLPFL